MEEFKDYGKSEHFKDLKIKFDELNASDKAVYCSQLYSVYEITPGVAEYIENLLLERIK